MEGTTSIGNWERRLKVLLEEPQLPIPRTSIVSVATEDPQSVYKLFHGAARGGLQLRGVGLAAYGTGLDALPPQLVYARSTEMVLAALEHIRVPEYL